LDKAREKRVRRLVSRLNRARKSQAKKIDILCNDLVGTQRSFLKQLTAMRTLLDFQQTLAGQVNLENLLESAASMMQDWIDDVNVAVYTHGSFRTHLVDCQILPNFDYEAFEQCFTSETIEAICSSRKCLDLDSLLMAGLQASPKLIKPICAVAVPLINAESRAFILLYRPAQKPIVADHLKLISSVIPFLSKSMNACQMSAAAD